MIDIGIPEITVTAKYEDTDRRSIKYDAKTGQRPLKRARTVGIKILARSKSRQFS